MKKLHVYTSAACNYVPKVRLLFQSLRKYHPEAVLHLLLADELPAGVDLSKEPVDVITQAKDLGIADFSGWAFCHSIVELSTAVKPFYLRQLLQRDDCEKVLYLDPDTVLYSRLDDILAALDRANVVLTPHQTDPEDTITGILDNELSSLKHGVYNLGFVGVAARPEGQRFAQFWAERCYYFCRSEIHNGIFTDQRWCDLVPAFFDDVAVSRSARHNTAPWNLSQRSLNKNGEQFQVGDEPLGFYHFTGFDSGAHMLASSKIMHKNPAVAELIAWYQTSIAQLAKDPLSQTPWRYGKFPDGSTISKAQRFLYRQRSDLQQAFPDPFDADQGQRLQGWFTHQGPVEYPELFSADAAVSAQAMVKQSADVGLLFDPHGQARRETVAQQLWASSTTSPQAAAAVVRRGIEILRTEGLAGVRKRLATRKLI
jgi:hypothetical protein